MDADVGRLKRIIGRLLIGHASSRLVVPLSVATPCLSPIAPLSADLLNCQDPPPVDDDHLGYIALCLR